MAQFIQGGADVLGALVHGTPTREATQYMHELSQRAYSMVTDTGRQWMEKAAVLFESTVDSNAVRIARAAIRAGENLWREDAIRPLTNIGELQHAPSAMLRWVMAEPVNRQLYHRQGCDGYSGRYFDTEPGYVGKDHSDYQTATHGMVVENAKGDFVATSYLNINSYEDTPLSFDERVDIKLTWEEFLAIQNRRKEDATSAFNAMLG